MLPSLANETVDILRPAKVTERGTTREDWGQAEEKPLTGCLFQPGTSAENGTVLTTTGTLYAPPDADITSKDRVRRGGLVYDIEGDPIRYAGALGHTIIQLKRSRG